MNVLYLVMRAAAVVSFALVALHVRSERLDETALLGVGLALFAGVVLIEQARVTL